jgi:hypothetical protein
MLLRIKRKGAINLPLSRILSMTQFVTVSDVQLDTVPRVYTNKAKEPDGVDKVTEYWGKILVEFPQGLGTCLHYGANQVLDLSQVDYYPRGKVWDSISHGNGNFVLHAKSSPGGPLRVTLPGYFNKAGEWKSPILIGHPKWVIEGNPAPYIMQEVSAGLTAAIQLIAGQWAIAQEPDLRFGENGKPLPRSCAKCANCIRFYQDQEGHYLTTLPDWTLADQKDTGKTMISRTCCAMRLINNMSVAEDIINEWDARDMESRYLIRWYEQEETFDPLTMEVKKVFKLDANGDRIPEWDEVKIGGITGKYPYRDRAVTREQLIEACLTDEAMGCSFFRLNTLAEKIPDQWYRESLKPEKMAIFTEIVVPVRGGLSEPFWNFGYPQDQPKNSTFTGRVALNTGKLVMVVLDKKFFELPSIQNGSIHSKTPVIRKLKTLDDYAWEILEGIARKIDMGRVSGLSDEVIVDNLEPLIKGTPSPIRNFVVDTTMKLLG